jgi:16S rRNA (uracil1498-N3)-methyltransferase
MELFYQESFQPEQPTLDKDESRHLVKVLRKTAGDQLLITDGKGNRYLTAIREASASKCKLHIIEHDFIPVDEPPLHLALAPTKNIDRTEWFVEKAVEIGIQKITFILCDRSERKKINLERLRRKAVAAMKQSYKWHLAQLIGLLNFSDFLKSVKEPSGCRYIAVTHTDPSNHLLRVMKANKPGVVVVGPEGDFSEKEVNLAYHSGFSPVSLSNHRLRTETAGVIGCHLMNLKKEVDKF